jgi:anti-anti-sigma factor
VGSRSSNRGRSTGGRAGKSGAHLAQDAQARLSIEAEVEESLTRVVLTGSIDLASAEQLDLLIDQLLQSSSQTVIVDLRGVTDLDSSGLRVLIAAEDQARRRGSRLFWRGDFLIRLRMALADYEGRYSPR